MLSNEANENEKDILLQKEKPRQNTQLNNRVTSPNASILQHKGINQSVLTINPGDRSALNTTNTTAFQGDYDGGQINILQETKLFDRKLKAKLAIQNDLGSTERAKVYLKYMHWPLYVIIFVYVLIMPFLTAPVWCVQYWNEIDPWQLTIDCKHAGSVHIDSTGYNKPIRLVGDTQLSILVSNSIDICLVSFLTFVRFYKGTYSKQSKSMKLRSYILLSLLLIAIIDGVLGIFVGKIFGYLSNWIRPIVAVVFMGQVRQ